MARTRTRTTRSAGDVAPGIASWPLERYLAESAGGKPRVYKPYYYGVNWPGGTLAGQDTVAFVNLDTDAPFLWTGTFLRDDQFDATGNRPLNATLTIRIGGPGGKAWGRTAPHILNVAGYRPQPCMLPAPWLVGAGSQFHCTLRPIGINVPGAILWVIFQGVKVYA